MKRKREGLFIIISSILLLALFIYIRPNILSITNPNYPSYSQGGYIYFNGSNVIVKDYLKSNEFIKTFATIISELCPAKEGFDYCYFSEYDYSDAKAHSEIHGTNLRGVQKSGYYIGDVYISVSMIGDKFYFYENTGSWDALWNNIAQCDENGCKNGQFIPSDYTYLLATKGQEYKGCPVFVAWDKDTTTNYWAQNAQGWGWQGGGDCIQVKSVECFDENDCSFGEYCNKDGLVWQDWNCQPKQCETNQEKCDNGVYSICENYKYSNKGKVLGKCGIECLTDGDCTNLNDVEDNVCIEGELSKRISNGFCGSNNKCSIETTSEVQEDCLLGCLDNSCIEKSKVFKYIIYSLLGILLFVFILTIKFRRKK